MVASEPMCEVCLLISSKCTSVHYCRYGFSFGMWLLKQFRYVHLLIGARRDVYCCKRSKVLRFILRSSNFQCVNI